MDEQGPQATDPPVAGVPNGRPWVTPSFECTELKAAFSGPAGAWDGAGSS